MKSLLKIYIIAASLALSTSCNRNDNFSTTATTAGSYRVSFYFDSKDETSNFGGYIFEFIAGGYLRATKGNTTIIGSWSDVDNRFNIVFPAGTLENLNNNWLLLLKTPDSIQLKDDNPAQNDQLIFSKI